MKAFILEAPGRAGFADMPLPELKNEYGAILRPIAMSVCTSDVNTVYGSGSKKPDRLILGHEAVALVARTGSEVRDFKEGDIVAVPSMTPDWRNPSVQEGNCLHAGSPFSSVALGRSISGVFAEYFMIEDADTTLAKLPPGVGVDDALMCVDMVTTGFRGAEAADIRFGDTVLVLGIGAIGLMAIAGASLRGAGRIIAVGSREVSISLARKYGATEVISYKDRDIAAYVKEATKGQGADAVLICGGGDQTLGIAYEACRYGIGRIVNLKHFAGEGEMGIPKFHAGRGMGGKTFYTELGMGGRRRLERLMELVRCGRISPGELITHRFEGFEHLELALELMRDKKNTVIKTKVVPEWGIAYQLPCKEGERI
ncbi:MAG: zinc-binding dehydrogenase [Johnsonella sp.]|nr:zinc-binding dehydrogenase [Johnsonella sp.]